MVNCNLKDMYFHRNSEEEMKMSLIKKLTAVMLVGALAFQASVPSFAAGTDKASDNTYYYTAVGDSATVGYNLDTLNPIQRNHQQYMNYT